MTRDYLTLFEAIELHQKLIELFGGAPGIREMGALETALMRPQMGYYESLTEEAASIMESLAAWAHRAFTFMIQDLNSIAVQSFLS